MRQPLSKVHVLGASTQRQEVTLHIERGIFLLEEVLARTVGVASARINTLSGLHCGRIGQGSRCLRGVASWRRLRGAAVHLRLVVVVVVVVVLV